MAKEENPSDKAVKDEAGKGQPDNGQEALQSEQAGQAVPGKSEDVPVGEGSLTSQSKVSDDMASVAASGPAVARQKSSEKLSKSKVDKKTEVKASTKKAGNPAVTKKTKPRQDSSVVTPSVTEKAKPGPQAGSSGNHETGKSQTQEKPVEQAVPQTSEDKQGTSNQKDTPTKKASKSGGIFSVLLIILLLAALAMGGYWMYTQRDQGDELLQLINRQQQTVTALEAMLREERMQRVKQSAVLEETTNHLQLRLNSQSNRLRELSTTTRNDWLLAEAEYLMRLANQRLVTERSTKNPVALLNTADEILRDLDEVDLFPVRKSLAEDITVLQMVVDVDREGLFLRLGALSDQLVKLPLLDRNPAGEKEPSPTTSEDEAVLGWQGRLLSSMQHLVSQLSDLIRVQRRDKPVEPLLSQEEELFVRHNLRILLEQAQLSLLREEQAVFKASLDKAQHWVRQYFQLNDNADRLVTQLDDLAQQPVVQTLPDISGSLEALREYIDSWHKRRKVSPADSEVGGDREVAP